MKQRHDPNEMENKFKQALANLHAKGFKVFPAMMLNLEIKLIDPTLSVRATRSLFKNFGIIELTSVISVKGDRLRLLENTKYRPSRKTIKEPSEFCLQTSGTLSEDKCQECPFVSICVLKERLFSGTPEELAERAAMKSRRDGNR